MVRVQERYEWAGAAAIICIVGMIIEIAFALIVGVQPRFLQAATLLTVVAISAATKVVGNYATLRFRHLLNERYRFHAVDDLILVLIAGGVLASAVDYGFKAIATMHPEVEWMRIVVVGVLCIALGAIGMVFATRLLRINENLNGYKKPLAYVCLTQSVCFLLFFTAPLGAVLEIVFFILLALVFFNSGEELEELEIV
jgi:hypothetical protein